jgi:SAM-dependent methyltransferase
MGFRLRKVRRIARDAGIAAAIGFVSRDIYFRALQLLAFPLHRESRAASAGQQPNPHVEFERDMRSRPAARVLEIGARAVSDQVARAAYPPPMQYVGFDLIAGPNVDVVGDAHELASYFPAESFDGVFSNSVFEHLLMPWKVILETNRILKPGGLALIATHPTWPPHELPWDFWRYQENAFWALFNRATGFELLMTITGTPARLLPASRALYLSGTVKTVCPMGVVALARKVANHDPRLTWPVRVADITPTSYPKP